MNIIEQARRFAKRKHKGQTYNNGDFMQHPEQVVKILQMITDDEQLLAAAWLHDILEDTDVTFGELVFKFGAEVADLVREVTKSGYNTFPDLSTRKGAMLKFADRLANLSNMDSWDENKQKKYIEKSRFWRKK